MENVLVSFLIVGMLKVIIKELISKQIDNFNGYNILQNIQIPSDLKDIIFTSDSISNNYILPDKKVL